MVKYYGIKEKLKKEEILYRYSKTRAKIYSILPGTKHEFWKRNYEYIYCNRCVQEAIEQCFVDLARKTAPEWVLEGDIKGCFDNINHEWMQKNIPMDKEILHKFLKAGFVEKGKLNATDQGTPQGGTISPTLCNYVLDGLERLLKNKFKRY